jgi:ankyrin repeat protein
MKLKMIPSLLCVLMTVGISSCGKKAQESGANKPDVSMNGSQAEVLEETHKELQAAIIANDRPKIMSLLESKVQVDFNVILADGETLMTTAVREDRLSIVELLFENSASVFVPNAKKETPLLVAAKLGLERHVRLLITLGSNPDAKDLAGNTALLLSIINGHEDVALYLINSKSNIDITNFGDQNALKLADSFGLTRVKELLRSLTQTSVGLPNKSDVRTLITLGDVNSLNQLFTKYPSIIYEYKDLNFYVLVMRSHPHDRALSITHLFMGYGADLDGPSDSEITPLIESVKQNYLDFVALMLKENVNPNTIDSNGYSALIWAIKANSQPMVKKFVDKNASEKYTYYKDGRKKTMKACDIAKEVKNTLTTTEAKKSNEDILDLLGCGLRWLL